jgi:hypothetical protein
MKSRLAILLIAVLTPACAQKQKDFDLVCEYFNQLEVQLDQQVMTPLERSEFILDKVVNNLSETSNARIAWEAITNAASERYALFVEAAESSGVSHWQCPAMQNLADTLE